MVTIQEQIKHILETDKTARRYANIYKTPVFRKWIDETYPDYKFRDDHHLVGYLIQHNLSEPPKCKNTECGNYLTFNKERVIFRNVYCCKECEISYKHQEDMYRIGAEKSKITCQERYGADHPMYVAEFVEKQRNTTFANHGVYSPLQNPDIMQRVKNTLKNRTGVDHPAKMPDHKKKCEATQMKNRGYSWHTKDPTMMASIGETNKERYGNASFKKSHLTKKTIDIIDNVKKLQKIVNKLGIVDAAKTLGVSKTLLYQRQADGLILPNFPMGSQEREIEKFLKEHKIPYHMNTRKIIGPKELDFYLPEHKVAIEFCGLYWHGELAPNPKLRNYHYDKWKKCDDLGIYLLTIYEDEFANNTEFWLNKILYTVGQMKFDKKIYARKCTVRELVDNSTTSEFLKKYHVQGSTSYRHAYGLYDEDMLISVMTFGNTRSNNVGVAELSRFCSVSNSNIVGAAGKLLKAFSNDYKDTYQEVISFSDNRYSNGNVYKSLGFELDSHLRPDYSYVQAGCIRHHKAGFRKSQIQKKFGLPAQYVQAHTEWELMQELKFDRIWDCGKKKWKITL